MFVVKILCRSEIQDGLQRSFFYGDPKLKVYGLKVDIQSNYN